MASTYNIYCDESCHLEHDNQGIMVLGALWCPLEKAKEIALNIRKIKAQHGLKPSFEIKWTKVSPSKISFYLDIREAELLKAHAEANDRTLSKVVRESLKALLKS